MTIIVDEKRDDIQKSLCDCSGIYENGDLYRLIFYGLNVDESTQLVNYLPFITSLNPIPEWFIKQHDISVTEESLIRQSNFITLSHIENESVDIIMCIDEPFGDESYMDDAMLDILDNYSNLKRLVDLTSKFLLEIPFEIGLEGERVDMKWRLTKSYYRRLKVNKILS